MTYTNKPIKALFLAIFLALSFGQPVRAQVVDTPATSAQVDALQQTLITLLTQLIAQLQEQIATLIAQQATQATQLGAVESKVSTIQTQTAPVVATPTPVPFRLFAGEAGSFTTYLESKDAGIESKKSLIIVRTNEPIDIAQTKLLVDGQERSISSESYRNQTLANGWIETSFYTTPNIFSFAPGGATFQLKVVSSDGDTASSQPVRCEASRDSSNNWWSMNCRGNMPLSQVGY